MKKINNQHTHQSIGDNNAEMLNSQLRNGYIALSSVLVISAVVIAIGVSTSLLSINEAQRSLAHVRNESTVDLVESCVEEALLYLNENGSVPTTIAIPGEGTCTITEDPPSGMTWTFTVTGDYQQHTKHIQVTADRTSTISVSSWKEVD